MFLSFKLIYFGLKYKIWLSYTEINKREADTEMQFLQIYF